jgi:CxxC motif-containing protein (DUF1111 family)
MNTRFRFTFVIATAMCSLLPSPPTVVAADGARERLLKVGRDLFEREWKPGEPASPGGDGLGPNFNDVSCVACHNLGGIGGAGPVEKNVDILSLPHKMRLLTNTQFRQLEDLHPAFILGGGEVNTTIVLHRFSTKPAYEVMRAKLIGEASHKNPHGVVRTLMQRQLSETPLKPVAASGFDLIRSQRNTTALFGAALIDGIPDEVLQQLAKRQEQRHPGISGRVAVTDEGAGHFGWRGATRRLEEFVLAACGNEVGLRVPGADQAMVPESPNYQPVGFDMSRSQSEAMIAFIADLPRPIQRPPRDPPHAVVINKGLDAFRKIGCALCHVENVGNVEGLFSDLLLHDMGPGLTDPAPAQPIRVTAEEAVKMAVASGQPIPQEARIAIQRKSAGLQHKQSRRRSSPYGGGRFQRRGPGKHQSETLIDVQTTNIFQEWRTPPLWGVQDSAPYLHDGRAETLTEAILMHGGEAAPSIADFIALDYVSRRAVLEFLGTLRSPFAKAQ